MPGSDRRSPAALGPPPDALRGLCAWLDQLPLSRPKRHLTRDFSDGVLVAEIVKHFHPRLVDLHSYIPACNTDQKLSNWSLLNRQGLQRVSKPTHIDLILCALREKGKAGNKFPDPGFSSMDAVHSQAGRTQIPVAGKFDLSEALLSSCRGPELMVSVCDTGLLSPPAPTSMKTLPKQRALEKKGSCACLPLPLLHQLD
uniref:Sperm flagellar protein 1-like n=1 Tax=Ictidomys tridecemlineatus TaxID=43179 RepID=A0A287D9W2_ICTTR